MVIEVDKKGQAQQSDPRGRVVWWRPTGALIEVGSDNDGKWLTIEDLNPQVTMQWRITRWELARIGLALIREALRRE